MKNRFIFLIASLMMSHILLAQQPSDQKVDPPVWTEEDRTYLLENLLRSKEELIAAVKDLSEEQWNFKEDESRWSINQIVEHVAIYELLFMDQIAVALQMGEFPQIDRFPPDSLFLGNSPENQVTTAFTEPFSYTVPLGNNEGPDNLTWLLTMRDESIEFVKSEDRNLRIYYFSFSLNVHQKLMQIFSHTDRHIKQIEKVKAHPNYPR